MKRIIQSTMMACFAWICVGLASCSDDAIVEVSQSSETGQPFRLTASQEAPSRLALGEDGLSVKWEPGDKLYLVKKDRSIPPIEFVADLDEPATEADFKSKGAVPAGEYHVVYNYNSDLVYGHHPFMSIDEINNQDNLALWGSLTVNEGDVSAQISLTHIYAKIRVELENAGDNCHYDIGMYASGANGFPILKKLTEDGLVDAYPSGNDYTVSENVKYHNVYLGFYPLESYVNGAGEEISNLDEVKRFSSLVLPANVSDGKLYFYVIDIDNNKCYEFQKTNVNFQEGKSYVVKLNLSEPNATSELQAERVSFPGETWESEVYSLNTAADCRHVAYRGGLGMYDRCSIEQDINFANEAFFPLNTTYILGNGNKLSNITLNWPDDNNVGLIRKEWSVEKAGSYDMYSVYYSQFAFGYRKYISDLTLENVTINGNDYVGALGGLNIIANDCTLSGSSSITASGDYVGGLVGYNEWLDLDEYGMKTISDNKIESSCTIQGNNYVGGLIGSVITGRYSNKTNVLMESCSSSATVTATGNYVGGIIGRIEGEMSDGGMIDSSIMLYGNDASFTLNECVNSGTITGEDYVAGIVGDFSVYGVNHNNEDEEYLIDRVGIFYSANEGKIYGDNYVGGIAGCSYATINTCYSRNEITASGNNIGGIVGGNGENVSSYIRNSYSLAKISVEEGKYAGGILGNKVSYWGHTYIENCYFAGTVTTNIGIVGNSYGNCNVNNSITTMSSLVGNWNTNVDYPDVLDAASIAGVQSIKANKSIINGERAYSDDIWSLEDYPAYCVKFSKGISGSITVPGFGSSEIEI